MAMDQKFINIKKFQKIFYLFKKYLFPRCFVAAAVAFRGTQSNQKCIKREVQWFFHTALLGFVLSLDLEKKIACLSVSH